MQNATAGMNAVLQVDGQSDNSVTPFPTENLARGLMGCSSVELGGGCGGGGEATHQCPLDAVSCSSLFLLTCALLMTPSRSEGLLQEGDRVFMLDTGYGSVKKLVSSRTNSALTLISEKRKRKKKEKNKGGGRGKVGGEG